MAGSPSDRPPPGRRCLARRVGSQHRALL